jgi:hypothetical protein
MHLGATFGRLSLRRRSSSSRVTDERDHDLGLDLDELLRRDAQAASMMARTCIS